MSQRKANKVLTKSRKRYSLQDRIDYYSKVMDSQWRDDAKSQNNKFRYASGFIQGAERGYSHDNEKINRFVKLGEIAGVKAREKSKNIKF